MSPDKSFLQNYGEFAARHTKIVLLVAFVITAFMAYHATSIEIETDFYKTLPQDLEALQNQNLLENVFSESDGMFILV